MSSRAGLAFDAGFLDEVRAANDIVEVIGELVALKRRGRNHVGLCPFHAEKTPSFTVSPEKQIFYCFGCGAGGDVFSFVQRREGLSFPDSVRRLAERAGLRVPEVQTSPEEARRRQERDRLRETLEAACAQYQRWLWSEAGKEALAYLEGRGFEQATLKEFRIGFIPAGWDGLVTALGKRGFQPEWLLRAGLASETEDQKRVYDRFRMRVMFPIADPRGRVVAFGGRVMPGAPDEAASPKYLNSPETELFIKGRQLYALDLARQAMRERGRATVVEGYVDAMSCHQAGFKDTVASLGTALTQAQGKLLLTQAKDVLVAYDADAAGQAATLRGMDVLAELGATVRVVVLPEGKDPDECIRAGGPGAFGAALERAEDYVIYRFRLAQREGAALHGQGTPQAAAAAARAVAPTLAALPSPVAREAYVQRFARALDVSEAAVMAEVRRSAAAGSGARVGSARPGGPALPGRPGAGTAAGTPHTESGARDNKGNAGSGLLGVPAYRRAEEQLLALMLLLPEQVVEVGRQIGPEHFPDEAYGQVARALFDVAAGIGAAAGAVTAAGMSQAMRAFASSSAAAGAGAGTAAVGRAEAGDGEGGAWAARLGHEVLRVLEAAKLDEAAALVGRLSVDAGADAGALGGAQPERVRQDCIRVLQEHPRTKRIIEVRQEVQQCERAGQPVPSHLLVELNELIRAVKARLRGSE